MMVSNTSDEVANLDYLTRYFRSSKYGSGDETFVGVEMMTGEHGDTIAKVTFKDPYRKYLCTIGLLSSIMHEQHIFILIEFYIVNDMYCI